MNSSLKRIGLAVICIAFLASIFAVAPVASQAQKGPVIDVWRWKITRSPAAQLVEMTLGPPTGSDMWTGMIRPSDVEAMDAQGKSVSSRSLLHFCEFGMNMRNEPLNDFNVRHALAHLVPKERIIGTLFKYINIKINTAVPPAQGLWYNAYVDPHPYSRDEAEDILTSAGYLKVSGEWKFPNGTDIPNMRVYCPLEITAPTSYTIARLFVDEAHAIGLASLNLEPMDFSTYTDLAFNEWDFDIFWVCWRLGRFPEQIYSKFHSSQLYLGSYNCYGVDWPALDAQIDIFYTGLDHPAKVDAIKIAQEMLFGGPEGSTYYMDKPMAASYQGMPTFCVYSRNAYDTQAPDLRGAVNMFGLGIENGWTQLNIHWNTPNGYRPGTTDRMVVPVLDEFPERMNPCFASTVYAWNVMDMCMDSLMSTNPYTLRDEPSVATSWSYGVEVGGMWVTFACNKTAGITWQDGNLMTMADIEFNWEFLADHQIPRYWGGFSHYINGSTTTDETAFTITAHMDTPSQWLIYDLAGAALILPPEVWTPWVGQPTSDILSWDPSQEAGIATPTKVYGTGAFILQHDTIEISTQGYADEVANRNYWRTTAEIQEKIANMFHSAGDVNYDGADDVEDLSAIGLVFDTSPPGNPDADICGPAGTPPDGKVDIDDLSTCGKYYGETMTVP